MKNELSKHSTVIPDVNVKINWIDKSEQTAILSGSGTLILHLQETDDQTQNILAATALAVRKIVCPTLRPMITETLSTAMDLALIKKNAQLIGKHAFPVFQDKFLAPLINGNKDITDKYKLLLEIDDFGIFVSIFIEELAILGDRCFSTGDASDKSHEVTSFLEFLLRLARRSVREEIPLEFTSRNIKVGILLLAKTETASTRGMLPYIERVKSKIDIGCESIYVVAYSGAGQFYSKLCNLLKKDPSINIARQYTLPMVDHTTGRADDELFVAVLRNKTGAAPSFLEKVKAADIKEGDIIEGQVIFINKDSTQVFAKGILGKVYNDLAHDWRIVTDLHETYQEGHSYQFLVLKIVDEYRYLELSSRIPTEDPWQSKPIPKADTVIDCIVIARIQEGYVCNSSEGFQFIIPNSDVSWTIGPPILLAGSRHKARLMNISHEHHVAYGSIKHVDKDPWPTIKVQLVPGTVCDARVVSISTKQVNLILPNSLPAYIPEENWKAESISFPEFKRTLASDQTIRVKVSKVKVDQRKIRVEPLI